MQSLAQQFTVDHQVGRRRHQVIIPLISPAKLSGIISRDGEVFIRAETLSTTGMKMATTPVELINAPRPATVSIR